VTEEDEEGHTGIHLTMEEGTRTRERPSTGKRRGKEGGKVSWRLVDLSPILRSFSARGTREDIPESEAEEQELFRDRKSLEEGLRGDSREEEERRGRGWADEPGRGGRHAENAVKNGRKETTWFPKGGERAGEEVAREGEEREVGVVVVDFEEGSEEVKAFQA